MILDSDILIDFLRGHKPAVAWLSARPASLCVSGITAIELAYGAKDAAGLRIVTGLLSRFTVEWPTPRDMKLAYEMAHLRLSGGLDGPGAITAAVALRMGLPAATFNVKHFQAVPNLAIVPPYAL